ncbi:hypothetical protein GGI11_002991 [Coemansia sp. RSA 2049]|nr:hypothetical protein H4217_008024 [Coemansia sp. RSA 1939]KAJ2518004.1 hypothetical protein GGI11_002991 [Coemansia sp. RSA 2049]KAJ2595218.1 hypothetical protein EV177_008185 [Coemansia sp. RSA 1804]KAJ2690258.1 hypothetical protein GGH99_002655 [Coemansia sp. RSA 1285]
MQLKASALVAYNAALLFASVAFASPVSTTSNFIVFGNSLSDNGNAAKAFGDAGYWEGRYSNSYVWDEYTSKLLGMNLINKAYGGATSNNDISPAFAGNASIPSFHDQVTSWLSENPSPSQFNLDNDIIQIEIGANDILHNVQNFVTDPSSFQSFAVDVAKSIATDIQTLIDAGYKNIDLWNIPAIERTPSVLSLQVSAQMQGVVQGMNSAIAQLVGSVSANNKANPNNVHIFDLYSLVTTCLEPQLLSALGITDSTDACYSTDSKGDVSICSNPDEHFFYDGVHPASRVHYTWGVVAAVLTRNPSTTLDANEILSLIKSFDIGSSNVDDNIIADGINSSESQVIPPPTTATEDPVPTSTEPSGSVHTTTVYKCH